MQHPYTKNPKGTLIQRTTHHMVFVGMLQGAGNLWCSIQGVALEFSLYASGLGLGSKVQAVGPWRSKERQEVSQRIAVDSSVQSKKHASKP